MEQTITISKETLGRYNSLMQSDSVDYEVQGIDRFACVDCWTAEFPDGYAVDVRVCSSDNKLNEPLWCEAILFKDGGECSCTDVFDTLNRMWELNDDGKEFIVHIIPTM